MIRDYITIENLKTKRDMLIMSKIKKTLIIGSFSFFCLTLIPICITVQKEFVPINIVLSLIIFFFGGLVSGKAILNQFQEIEKSKDELLKRNAELTKKYSELVEWNEKFRLANELLGDTTEELRSKVTRSEKLAFIKQFTSAINHELRNPLLVIKNAHYYIKTKILKSGIAQNDDKLNHFIDLLSKQVEKCNDIITDFLSFTKQSILSLSEVNIEDIINEASDSQQFAEGIRVQKEYGCDIPKIKLDKRQIGVVFSNLISNACDSMGSSGILTITTELADNRVYVKFKDTGHGIPEKVAATMFEPLITTKTKGTGLGLSICKTIVEAHKGKIYFKNIIGEQAGAEFIVDLPV